MATEAAATDKAEAQGGLYREVDIGMPRSGFALSCYEAGMKRLTPIVIATIGDMLRHQHRMWGFCPECDLSKELDLKELGEQIGEDYKPSAHDGTLPLRCSRCGHKPIRCLLSGARR